MNDVPSKVRDKEESVAKNRAELLRVDYADVRQMKKSDFFPDLISIDDIDKYKVVPIKVEPQRMQVGFSLQTPQASLEEIQKLFPEKRVFFTYISQSGYNEIREKYYEYSHKDEPQAPSPEELANQLADHVLEVNQQLKDSAEINLFDKNLGDTNQSDLFKFITQQGYLLDASDIHIEPSGNTVRIRFRIDGTLHIVGSMDSERYKVLLNDIQMKAGIRWNADYPQTGSIKTSLLDKDKEAVDVNMRIETVPTTSGSDIVIRIFSMQEKFLDLDNLGFSQEQRDNIDNIIKKPHGLVLVVGPTGSGKSSTLYSIIQRLNSPENKIVTLEDPVEYQIEGITQISAGSNKEDDDDKETFMDWLSAVMRGDPDIIMIGEIRDEETARTALQASLTGHLVLSSFHATNGAAALSRILDLIDYSPLLASSIRLIMPQRLLRRLCEDCKKAYEPDKELLQIITQALQGVAEQPDKIKLFKAVGCDKCHNIGYKGRIIASEQFQITTSIKEEIAKRDNTVSADKLQELAVADGMMTMLQDGMLKAINGDTSIEEVFRVVDF